MKAVTWQGKRNITVETVPDPVIVDPTDAIIKITSSGLCGSDLHLYEVMEPFMGKGNILGHEPMGIVQEVGAEVKNIKPGDRVVIPFNISCGHCFMCKSGLQSQCETTQVHDHGKGAALFGFSKLYGEVPGGQAEYLRVPHADYGPIKVPHELPDDRFVYLSDVLPTAWQAVDYAHIPQGGSVVIMGLGPIGDMSARIARHRGAGQVIVVDLVPERLQRAKANGFDVIDLRNHENDLLDVIKSKTNGFEAHGSPVEKFVHQASSLMPKPMAAKVFETAGVDRMNALHHSIDAVRRGGTISIIGVYVGMVDPMPMDTLFDKQVTMRMGQANVKRWIDDIMPLLVEKDVLGVDDFATHRMSLSDAPHAYDLFQKKEDGAIKIVFQP